MAQVKFFIKGTKKGKRSPVYIRLYHGKEIDIKISSGLFVDPAHWKAKDHCVGNFADADDYRDKTNTKLRELKDKVLNSLPPLDKISKDWLTEIVDLCHNPQKNEVRKLDLFSFIRNFIDRAPTRLNLETDRPVCYKQVREYERTFFYLQQFAKQTKRNYDFEDIDLDFYHEFITFLQSKKEKTQKDGTKITVPGLAKNTIGKKIQTLKIFLNAAIEEGVTTFTKYKSRRFKAIEEESDNVYLNEKELHTLSQLDLSNNPRLDKVRDLFLIGCWTGLRFSDWNQVKASNIEDGFLTVKQSKTQNPVVIPIHSTVAAIIKKYNDQLPPMISNQKFNDYLKEVAQLAGLNSKEQKKMTKEGIEVTTSYEKWERISTHTGRRSFATNAYKAEIPSLSIMAVTGHKTESSFLKYIKVTPKEHAEKIRDIWMNRPFMRVVNE